MKMALIQEVDGRVAQVVESGQEFPVASGLKWVECPDEVKTDSHEYDDGFIEKEKPVVDIDRKNADEAMAAIDADAIADKTLKDVVKWIQTR